MYVCVVQEASPIVGEEEPDVIVNEEDRTIQLKQTANSKQKTKHLGD